MTLATRAVRGLVDPFDSTGRDFDSFVQRVFGRDIPSGLTPYGVDIYEDADKLHVEAELPGFTREQVDVTIDNNVLTITADRTNNMEDKQENWHLKERRYARFQRSFSLPNTIDGSSVDAKLADGVLHVVLNKRQEAKPRKINIG
jgi:HSP20 family protein